MRYTNRLNLPRPWFLAAQLDYQPKPNRISVSALVQPIRKSILERQHWKEITVDVADQTWVVFGRLIHEVLAKDPGDALHELPLEMKIGKWTVSGRLDRYVNGRIEDWKTTSVWSYLLGDRSDWERQLNCYAGLLEHQKKLPVNDLQVVAIFRDWRKGESRQREEYPEPLQRISIPLWGYCDRMDFIRERVELYEKSLEGSLPECTDEERWVRDQKWSVVDPSAKPKQSGWRSPKRHPSLGFNSGLHDSEESAQKHIDAVWEDKAQRLEIEFRPGMSIRCDSICGAAPFCEQWARIRSESVRQLDYHER